MQLVDEYFRRAKATLAEAEKATGQELKKELRRLAEQWESLARARLELISHQTTATTVPAIEKSQRAISGSRG